VACLLILPSLGGATSLNGTNEQTRQLVQKVMKERRIPGLQITVIKDGRLVLSESYGLANVEDKVPVSSKTLFPLNSGTKPFTGVAMMQLTADGLVDLNAPVSRYLDALPAAWGAIRVRQLLAHTSGLPDIVDERGLMAGGTESGMWKAVRERAIESPAGERFSYNQANYSLLAEIIVKQSGLPYERYVAERQFAVADMRASIFGDSYDPVPNAVTIYSYFPRRTLAPDDSNRLSRWLYEMPQFAKRGRRLDHKSERDGELDNGAHQRPVDQGEPARQHVRAGEAEQRRRWSVAGRLAGPTGFSPSSGGGNWRQSIGLHRVPR